MQPTWLYPSPQVGRRLRVGGRSASITSSIGRGLRVGGQSAGITSSIGRGLRVGGRSAGITSSIGRGLRVGGRSAGITSSIGRGLRVGRRSAGITSSIGRGLRVGGRSAGITSSIGRGLRVGSGSDLRRAIALARHRAPKCCTRRVIFSAPWSTHKQTPESGCKDTYNTSVIHVDRHHTGSSPLSKICTRYTCFCYPFSRPICRQVALSSYSICNADCHWSSPLSLASS